VGFFLDANDSTFFKNRDPKALRVSNLLQDDMGAPFLFLEFRASRDNVRLNDVVAKNDADLVTSRKVLR